MTKNELACEMNSITKKYFRNAGWGTEEAVVSYFEYDIKKYTFKYVSRTFNARVDMYLKGYEYDAMTNLGAYKKEIRKFLKDNGFTKVKFNIKNVKLYDGAFGSYYTKKELVAIYFDV